jgi:hypothetical protein
VINTQTAFLLADLNNQTQQENVSIYYTQIGGSLDQMTQSSLNSSNLTLNATTATTQLENTMDKSQSAANRTQTPAENEIICLDETTASEMIEISPSLPKPSQLAANTQALSAKDILDFDEASPRKSLISEDHLPQPSQFQKQAAVFIDETIIEDSSSSCSDDKRLSSSSSSSSSSNLLDQNLDLIDETMSVEPPATPKPHLSTTVLVDDNSGDEEMASHQTPKNNSCLSKKRKSVDFIEINDETSVECVDPSPDQDASTSFGNKKFKKDPQPISANSSSSSLVDLSTELVTEQQILQILSDKTQLTADENGLEEVWQNFGENNFSNEQLPHETTEREIEVMEVDNVKKSDEKHDEEVEEVDDLEVEEFIRNYRDKMNEKKVEFKAPAALPPPLPPVLEEKEDESEKTPITVRTKPRVNELNDANDDVTITPMPNYKSMDTPNLKV